MEIVNTPIEARPYLECLLVVIDLFRITTGSIKLIPNMK